MSIDNESYSAVYHQTKFPSSGDPELDAAHGCMEVLDQLLAGYSDESKIRVLRYLTDRYEEQSGLVCKEVTIEESVYTRP